MRRAFIAVLSLVVGVLAAPAIAGATTDPVEPGHTGYIEICKAANPALIGSFRFSIDDHYNKPITVDVPIGTCTNAIAVEAGSVRVEELGSLAPAPTASAPTRDFLGDPTFSARNASGPLSMSGTGFVRHVDVVAGDTPTATIVDVSNSLVTGVVEVCKNIATGSVLTGSWQFAITGGNGFSATASTAIGNCTGPIIVPAGRVMVVETGDAAQSVTEITAIRTPSAPQDVVLSKDLAAATVVAGVVPGDASTGTIVTFTNNDVTFKVCKSTDGQLPSWATSFTFRFAVTAGNAGPNGPINPVTLAATGTLSNPVCTVVGRYRAGTTVTVTEDVVPGTKVGLIVVQSSDREVAGSRSLPNRTVAVVLGSGETIVWYHNVKATNGTLKLCKAAGVSNPAFAAGTPTTFTITPLNVPGSPATVTVPAGAVGAPQCVIVTTASPFNATWSIVESAITNVKVQSITAVPTYVVVGGQNTNQLALTSVDLPNRRANVTIGENNITEVLFVNIDPLPESGGGGSSGGSGSSGGGSSITPVVTPGGVVITNIAGTAQAVVTNAPITKPALVINKKAVKAATLRKQLAALKVTQTKLTKQLAATKSMAAKSVLVKRLAVVKASQKRIALQLQQLRTS